MGGSTGEEFTPPGGMPAEASPLSPLPSPSHRPGEGDSVEAVVLIGCLSAPIPILVRHLQAPSPQQGPPLPDGGRAMGEGTGVRFRAGGRPPHEKMAEAPRSRP